MATITYTLFERCPGGGHTTFDVSLNGGANRRVTYTTDELRVSLGSLSEDHRELLALLVLKAHMMGKTRAEIVTELNAGPVTVTL